MTRYQELVLRLLRDHPAGLFGSQVFAMSKGAVNRGYVYVVLEQLVDDGLVREQVELATDEYRLARTRHFITDAGAAALAAKGTT